MSTALTIAGLVVGPGGILYGVITWLTSRRKIKVDSAVALNASTLSYAADLRADLDALNKRMDTLTARINARDTAVFKHMPWDWHVYRILKDLGYDIEEPPPLLPMEQHQ